MKDKKSSDTPQIETTSANQVKTIELLLNKKANPNVMRMDGATPLLEAASYPIPTCIYE